MLKQTTFLPKNTAGQFNGENVEASLPFKEKKRRYVKNEFENICAP